MSAIILVSLISAVALSRADAGACLWKRKQPSGSCKVCCSPQ